MRTLTHMTVSLDKEVMAVWLAWLKMRRILFLANPANGHTYCCGPGGVMNKEDEGLISLDGLSRADVLAALYNNAKPQGMGMGFLHYEAEDMGRTEAALLLREGAYFDYVKGRVMKVDLSTSVLNPRLYDRDNGEGAAFRVIVELRAKR